MLNRPFRFLPMLKRTMWGGARLLAMKGCSPMVQGIGESWEISGLRTWESVVADGPDKGLTITQLIKRYGADLMGRGPYSRLGDRFPLLIKFLDAGLDLSVQVHPSAAMTAEDPGCLQKDEMWYVIDSYPDSRIYLGFNRPVSPHNFDRCVADGSIMDCITAYQARRGEFYYVPSGTIHALGAGNFVLEIQACSDDTYRVYDFNRTDANGEPRMLHLDKARRALDFNAFNDSETRHRGLMVDGERIQPSVYHVNGSKAIDMPDDSFTVVICMKGRAEISYSDQCFSMRQGETVLLPATVNAVNSSGRADIMTVTLANK